MSLNGLDSAGIVEAYETALAEPAGWFLVHYISRDTVQLSYNGIGGLPEVRAHAVNFCNSEPQPLFGLVLYRGQKVLVKLLPDKISRLVQARATVHFTEVIEQFTHDVVVNLTSPNDFIDTVFASACSLSPVPDITSTSGGLVEFASPIPDLQATHVDKTTPSDSNLAPDANSNPLSSSVDPSLIRPSTSNLEPVVHTLPFGLQRSATNTPPEVRASFDSSRGPSSGLSLAPKSTLSDLTFNDLYDSLKLKPKLGPRPSTDSRHRPSTSGTRQVSNLPAGLARQQNHQRHISSNDSKGGLSSSNSSSRPRSRGQDSIRSTRSVRSVITSRSATQTSDHHLGSPTIVLSATRESVTTIRGPGSNAIASDSVLSGPLSVGTKDLYGYSNQLTFQSSPVDRASLYANMPVTPTGTGGLSVSPSRSRASATQLTPEKERLMRALQQFKQQQNQDATVTEKTVQTADDGQCRDSDSAIADPEFALPMSLAPEPTSHSVGTAVFKSQDIIDEVSTESASGLDKSDDSTPSHQNDANVSPRPTHDLSNISTPVKVEISTPPGESVICSSPKPTYEASAIPTPDIYTDDEKRAIPSSPPEAFAKESPAQSQPDSLSGETAPTTEADTEYTRPNSTESGLDKAVLPEAHAADFVDDHKLKSLTSEIEDVQPLSSSGNHQRTNDVIPNKAIGDIEAAVVSDVLAPAPVSVIEQTLEDVVPSPMATETDVLAPAPVSVTEHTLEDVVPSPMAAVADVLAPAPVSIIEQTLEDVVSNSKAVETDVPLKTPYVPAPAPTSGTVVKQPLEDIVQMSKPIETVLPGSIPESITYSPASSILERSNRFSQDSIQMGPHTIAISKSMSPGSNSASGSDAAVSPFSSHRSVSTPIDRQPGAISQDPYRQFRSISSSSSRPGSSYSQHGSTAPPPPMFVKRTNVSSGISQRIQKLAENSANARADPVTFSRPAAAASIRSGRFGQSLDVLKSKISAVNTKQKSILDSMGSTTPSGGPSLGYLGEKGSRASLSSHSFVGNIMSDSRSPSPMLTNVATYQPLSRTNSAASTSMPPPPFIPHYAQRNPSVVSVMSTSTLAVATVQTSSEPSVSTNSVSVTATIVRDSDWKATASGPADTSVGLLESPLIVERRSIVPQNAIPEPTSAVESVGEAPTPTSHRESGNWNLRMRMQRMSESKSPPLGGHNSIPGTPIGQTVRPMSVIEGSNPHRMSISKAPGENLVSVGRVSTSSSVLQNVSPNVTATPSSVVSSGGGSTASARTSRTDKLRHRVSLTIGSVGLKTLGELISPSSMKAKGGLPSAPAPIDPKVGQVQTMQALGGDVTAPEVVPSMTMLDDVLVGDVNVQFPDGLLWKRRYVTISPIGEVVFSFSKPTLYPPGTSSSQYSSSSRAPGTRPQSSISISGLSSATRRYHISFFRQPSIPDRDCEELPYSVVLSFYDGRSLQCACDNAANQKRVLMALNESWRVWGANSNVGEETRLGGMVGEQTLMGAGQW